MYGCVFHISPISPVSRIHILNENDCHSRFDFFVCFIACIDFSPISYYNDDDWFIIRFPMGLDFLFITFCLHFFLSWMSSLSISSSAISASTLSDMSFLALQPVFCLQPYASYISSPSPHHFSSSHVHTISAYHF